MYLKLNFKKKLDKQKIIDGVKSSPLFLQAFTHVSYLSDKDKDSYENLEFLGDSILSFLVSFFLFKSFPNYSEGEMSKLKQFMVREETLYILSKDCNFDSYIRVGNTEKKNGAHIKVSVIADVFESFIALLYLEKGIKEVWKFLFCTLFEWIKGKENTVWDYKSKLQEYCQAKKIRFYYVTEFFKKLENNSQIFISTLCLDDYYQQLDSQEDFYVDKEKSIKFNVLSEEKGKGFSKKEAEQNAAKKTLSKFT